MECKNESTSLSTGPMATPLYVAVSCRSSVSQTCPDVARIRGPVRMHMRSRQGAPFDSSLSLLSLASSFGSRETARCGPICGYALNTQSVNNSPLAVEQTVYNFPLWSEINYAVETENYREYAAITELFGKNHFDERN